jgi:hypothetical protein
VGGRKTDITYQLNPTTQGNGNTEEVVSTAHSLFRPCGCLLQAVLEKVSWRCLWIDIRRSPFNLARQSRKPPVAADDQPIVIVECLSSMSVIRAPYRTRSTCSCRSCNPFASSAVSCPFSGALCKTGRNRGAKRTQRTAELQT